VSDNRESERKSCDVGVKNRRSDRSAFVSDDSSLALLLVARWRR
jgi:hypothetical protein